MEKIRMNSSGKVKNDEGRFLVLADYGMDGISVVSQHETRPQAVSAGVECGFGQIIVVEVVTIEVE